MTSNQAQKRKAKETLTATDETEQPNEQNVKINVLSQQSQWVAYPSDSEGDDLDAGYESGSDLGEGDDDQVPIVDLHTTAQSLMTEVQEDAMSPRVEKFFDLLIWSIPFTSLFVLLDVMIHQQYAMHPTLAQEFGRMIGTVPILVAIIWLTTISPRIPRDIMQYLFFAAAIMMGSSFIWIFHKSPFMEVIRRTPPLGTLWIYCVVKLDLIPCVTSVAAVGGFAWWNELPLTTHSV